MMGKTKSLLLAAMLLACASTAAAAERVADILQDFRRNGIASLEKGLVRLQAAGDRPGPRAPVEYRREFHAAVGSLAVLARNDATTLAAIKALQQMAEREQCRPCGAEFRRLQAALAVERKDLAPARKLLEQAVPLASPDDHGLQLELALLLARLHSMQGEPQLAVSEAVRAARLADTLQDVGGRVAALQMVMVGNMDLQDFERAEAAGEEALALARKHSISGAVAVLRLNQGHLYALTGRSDLQLKALKESLALSLEGEEVSSEIHMLSLSNLAAHALDHGRVEEGEDYARRAEALARRLNNPQAQAAALVNWGLATVQKGDLEAGVRRVREGIAISDRLGMKTEAAAMLETVVWAYYDAGRFEQAYREMQDVMRRRQALVNTKHEHALIELQEQYAADRRQQQLAGLAAESRLRSLQLEAGQRRLQMWVTLSLSLLLAAWMGVKWLYRLRGRQRQLASERQALHHQTRRDALTGVFNRQYGKTLMDDYARQPARPEGVGVGLMMIDVDHFKRINDTLGHAVGDRVLVAVAGRLQRQLNAEDALVRWGGEEFLVVVHAVSDEGLAILARRLLAAVAVSPVEAGQRTVPTTVSIGCVRWSPQRRLGWTEAIDLADRALYQAKGDGRNRAVCIVTDVLDGAATAGLRGRGLDGLAWRSVTATDPAAASSAVVEPVTGAVVRPIRSAAR